MKILVAIVNPESPDTLGKNTLSWAPRAGYNMRLFLPDESQLSEYFALIDHINYDQYLDLRYAMVVVGHDPKEYAEREGYDLLVTLPSDLKAWNKTRDREMMVIQYAEAIGAARVRIGNGDEKQVSFPNGAVMERVK